MTCTARSTSSGDALSRFQLLRGDRDRPLLSPPTLFLTAEAFFVAAQRFARLDLHAPALARDDPDLIATDPLPIVAVERRAADPLHALKAFLATTPLRVLVLAESPGRRETMTEYFAQYGLAPSPCAGLGEFLAADARSCSASGRSSADSPRPPPPWSRSAWTGRFCDHYRSRAVRRHRPARAGRDQAKRSSIEGMLRDLSELAIGDPVVHEQHGVGRYRGLVSLDLGDGPTEFLQLEYADADKLYVPVAQLHTIGRYSGGPPSRRRCTSSAAPTGKRRNAKRPPRSATPRPSCSRSTPNAPRGRAAPST